LPRLSSFEPEVANVVAAIRWLDETGRHDELLELVSAASSFWLAAGRPSEARPWLRRAIDVSRGPSAWTARLLRNAGAVENDLGATAHGVDLIRASIREWEALGDDAERADALRRLGASLYDRGERDEARRVLLESAAIAASADDEGTQRASLADLAGIAIDEGDIAEAGALLGQLLDASTRVGDEFGVAMAHGNLSYVRLLAGDLDGAESEARIAVDAFTLLNKDDILGWCLVNLAGVVAEKGGLDEASELGRRGLRLIQAQGSVRDLSSALDTLSTIGLKLGDARRALRLAIAARRVRVDAELALTGAEAESVQRHVAEAQAALGANADAIEREVASEPIDAIVGDEIADAPDGARSAVSRVRG
jgi:tetratricopeptide (TPR) repeat protein